MYVAAPYINKLRIDIVCIICFLGFGLDDKTNVLLSEIFNSIRVFLDSPATLKSAHL